MVLRSLYREQNKNENQHTASKLIVKRTSKPSANKAIPQVVICGTTKVPIVEKKINKIKIIYRVDCMDGLGRRIWVVGSLFRSQEKFY